jgi:hypothetical protein
MLVPLTCTRPDCTLYPAFASIDKADTTIADRSSRGIIDFVLPIVRSRLIFTYFPLFSAEVFPTGTKTQNPSFTSLSLGDSDRLRLFRDLSVFIRECRASDKNGFVFACLIAKK